MNPAASSFAPKPSYAETVKATLPQRGTGEHKMPTKNAGILGGEGKAQRATQDSAQRLEPELKGKGSVASRPSRDPVVTKDGPSTPGTQSAKRVSDRHMPSGGFPNPPVQTSRHSNDWHPHYNQQPPVLWPNPLTGPYETCFPVPVTNYLHHGHYQPHFHGCSPFNEGMPLVDPAACVDWNERRRHHSAWDMFGPFCPAAIPIPSLHHHPAYLSYPMPPFTPFPGWPPGQPPSSIYMTDQMYQVYPEPNIRSPSKGKCYQIAREAKWPTQSRERGRNRVAAWRARESNPATPIHSEHNNLQGAASHAPAQDQATPRQTLPSQAESAQEEDRNIQQHRSDAAPKAQQERGRTRYRLIGTKTTKSKYFLDETQRLKQRRCLGHESESSADSSVRLGNDKVDPREPTPSSSYSAGEIADAIALRVQSPKPASVKADGPPANAPTGPSSSRRYASTQPSRAPQSLTLKPAEQGSQGSWSQSKRWVSQETKERIAFQRLMHNLHYMGADKSPCLPKTPAELTRFKVAEAEQNAKSMAQELLRLQENMRRRRGSQVAEPMNGIKAELFEGRRMAGKLSPVFASECCFNDSHPAQQELADWPSRAELKEDGDRRAARYGRYLPLPRLNIVHPRILEEEEDPYNADGTISWEKKALKPIAMFIRPVTSELDKPHWKDVQFKLEELHMPLRGLLEEIDGVSRTKSPEREKYWI